MFCNSLEIPQQGSWVWLPKRVMGNTRPKPPSAKPLCRIPRTSGKLHITQQAMKKKKKAHKNQCKECRLSKHRKWCVGGCVFKSRITPTCPIRKGLNKGHVKPGVKSSTFTRQQTWLYTYFRNYLQRSTTWIQTKTQKECNRSEYAVLSGFGHQMSNNFGGTLQKQHYLKKTSKVLCKYLWIITSYFQDQYLLVIITLQ